MIIDHPLIGLYFQGLSFALVLIIAIGAQNAFVLQQGLKRQHVFVVVNICVFSDILIMVAGTFTLSWVKTIFSQATLWIYAFGIIFLFAYGLRSFLQIRGDHTFEPVAEPTQSKNQSKNKWLSSRGTVILSVLALTYFNPHFYLDMFFLVGGRVAVYNGLEQLIFGLGAASASFVWFYSLGYGSALLAPLFKNPRTWKWLYFSIGVLMWVLSAVFLREFFALLSVA